MNVAQFEAFEDWLMKQPELNVCNAKRLSELSSRDDLYQQFLSQTVAIVATERKQHEQPRRHQK